MSQSMLFLPLLQSQVLSTLPFQFCSQVHLFTSKEEPIKVFEILFQPFYSTQFEQIIGLTNYPVEEEEGLEIYFTLSLSYTNYFSPDMQENVSFEFLAHNLENWEVVSQSGKIPMNTKYPQRFEEELKSGQYKYSQKSFSLGNQKNTNRVEMPFTADDFMYKQERKITFYILDEYFLIFKDD